MLAHRMDRLEAQLTDIRKLLATQRLAVVASQQQQGPYTNLVAFAETEDLKHILFVTSRPTQKYRNLSSNPSVSMLIDSRSNQESDFHDAVVVSVLGTVSEVTEPAERDALAAVFLAKHPYLKDFHASPSTALLDVAVERFIWVDHFQHVVEIQVPS